MTENRIFSSKWGKICYDI